MLFALLAGGAGFAALGVALTIVGLLSYFLTYVWASVLLAVAAAALWIVRALRERISASPV